MLLAAGEKLGPYEIMSRIGKGGMGEVYRARDPRLGRDVAIKVSAERFTERFQREARIIASLNHPNICTLYDVGPDYLVMELVDGPTLADRVKEGAIPLDEALGVARQIAEALGAAHEKGIVHRDLKPANVKITPEGLVKVLDFGLASAGGSTEVMSDDSPTASVGATEPGMILGTAAYMAPEQALGKRADKRVDIWAFGVVLYEMLTGRRLFSGQTTTELLAAVLKEEPDLSRVPAKARLLLRRCLLKDPKQRLRDIGDAMALTEGMQDAAPEIPAARAWLAWTMCGVFLLAAAILAFLRFQETPHIVDPALLEIAVPDGLTFIAGTQANFSPDGHTLAFAAKSSDGKTRMYVRPRNSREVKLVPGTEVAGYSPPPFWSFDSRSIIFAGGGWLKRADIFGTAPPQLLCELKSVSQGSSMNRDGVIIFAGSGSALSRVTANRTATPLTILAPGEKGHRWPQFLPDNRHFLYHRESSSLEKTGIYVGSIDAKAEENQDSPIVLQTDLGAYYVPALDGRTGWLVFMRESTLLAQSFNPATWKLSGEEILIAKTVGSVPTARAGLFSVSGTGDLAYRASPSLRQLTWKDTKGNTKDLLAEPGQYYSLTLSPVGEKVAMQEIGPGGRQDIVIIDKERGKTQLTNDAHRNDSPIWDPTETKIAFASNRLSAQMDLYEYDLKSGKERLLLHNGQDKAPTSWSSDGNFILFTSWDSKTSPSIWVLRRSDLTTFPFSKEEYAYSGAFSPHGDSVAYTSRKSGITNIYIQPFSIVDGVPSSIGKVIQVSKDGGSQAQWRAKEGKQLFYRTPSDQIFAVDMNGMEPSLPPKFLFDANTDTGNDDRFGVTSDGKRFLFHALPPTSAPPPFIVLLNLREWLKK